MDYLYIANDALIPNLNKVFTQDTLREIYCAAKQSYPNECCGLILQQGIKKCVNNQDYLHNKDPITYSRTAREGFTFSSEDALFLSKNINSKNPVKAIYHSHPDVGAYFSEEDKENALFDGEPIYPVDHLVVDIQNGKIVCSKIFRFINNEFCLIAILPNLINQI